MEDIYFNIVTDLDLSFSLKWEGKFMPRKGDYISFEDFIDQTDVHSDYRQILKDNSFKIIKFWWVNFNEAHVFVIKS
jgi:hypothetical protein